jgi:outer membrane protein assembly factor BamA
MPPAQTAVGTEQRPSTEVANPLQPLSESIWTKAGVPVTGTRFEGVTFAPHDAIVTDLTQKAGEPLDPQKVRADIRRLYASGRYRDISVSGETNGNGLTLIYAGVPRYYVGRVEVNGIVQERLASLLEFATKLDPGTPFSEPQIPAALAGEAIARAKWIFRSRCAGRDESR